MEEYARSFAEKEELNDGEDINIEFYKNDDDKIFKQFWISELKNLKKSFDR